MPDPNVLITHLDLSVRTYYCLHRAGLFTVAAIVEKSPDELLEIRNFGRRCLTELREKLIDAGYDDPWPELDGPPIAGDVDVPRLGLSRAIETALLRARRRTLGMVLGTPADDLVDILGWPRYQELRSHLIELGHAEPGNIERDDAD
jgi:hypothetical protein